jgi:hypothetical protein
MAGRTNFIGLFLEGDWGGRGGRSMDLDLWTGVAIEEAIVGNRRIGIGRAGLRDRAAAAALIVIVVIFFMVASRGIIPSVRFFGDAERSPLRLGRLLGRLAAVTGFLAMAIQKITVGRRQRDADGDCGKEERRSDQNGFLHGMSPVALTGALSPSRLTAA